MDCDADAITAEGAAIKLAAKIGAGIVTSALGALRFLALRFGVLGFYLPAGDDPVAGFQRAGVHRVNVGVGPLGGANQDRPFREMTVTAAGAEPFPVLREFVGSTSRLATIS